MNSSSFRFLLATLVVRSFAGSPPGERELAEILYKSHSCASDPTEEVVRTVVPKISASLSLLGSSFIMLTVGQQWKTNPTSVDPYQRIMAAYSLYDIVVTFFQFFMGSWMTPTETGWLGASGNAATCSLQGFAFHFGGFGSALYQMTLSLQMMLLVTYKWTPRKFERKLEYRLHWLIFVLSTIFAAVPLFSHSYNPVCGDCLVYPLPYWCEESMFEEDGTECKSGSSAVSNIYLFLVFFCVVTATFFSTGAMFVIYRSVYKQEQRNARHTFGDDINHTMSKRIRKSMILYTSSFYICWVIPMVCVKMSKVPKALVTTGWIIAPLMGFFNMLVFILPKCIKYQKQHAGTSLLGAYFYTMFEIPITVIRERITFRQASADKTNQNTPVQGRSTISFRGYNQGASSSALPGTTTDNTNQNTPVQEKINDMTFKGYNEGTEIPEGAALSASAGATMGQEAEPVRLPRTRWTTANVISLCGYNEGTEMPEDAASSARAGSTTDNTDQNTPDQGTISDAVSFRAYNEETEIPEGAAPSATAGSTRGQSAHRIRPVSKRWSTGNFWMGLRTDEL